MARQTFYAEADSETGSESNDYAANNKATLAFTPDDNATYYLVASWQAKFASTGGYAQTRFRRTSGTAKTFQESHFNPNATADYAAFGGLAIESFGASPGEQTYKTQVASSDNSSTHTAKNHRIIAIRKETGDQDAADDSSSNATGSFQDKLTKTFTPGSTGDYLILASLDVTWFSGDFPELQLLVDSTVYGLVRPDNFAAANRHSWAVVAVVNLDNTSHTLKIQYKRANGSATVSVANARLIALRLDAGFEDYFSDSDPTLATTTSTTYQDRSVVTQTLEAQEYLVISSQSLRLNVQNSAAALGKLIEDATDKITARHLSRQAFNESVFSVFTIYKKTFTAASYTLKTQYASQTSGQTIGQRDSVIALLQLTAAGGNLTPLSLAGSLSPSGALVRQTRKAGAGALTPTGQLAKLAQRLFIAAISPAGALRKSVRLFIGGAISPAALLNFLRTIFLAGAISPNGSLVNLVNRAFAGAVSPAGSLAKSVRRAFSGAITPTGAVEIVRAFVLYLAGAISPAGLLTKKVARTITGSITPVGALAKSVFLRFTGAISPAGAIEVLRAFVLYLAGAITPTGTTSKFLNRSLSGLASPTGLVRKSASAAFSGAISPAGSAAKAGSKSLSGALALAGQLQGFLVHKRLAGTAAPTGSVRKFVSRLLTGALTLAGNLIKSTLGGFAKLDVEVADRDVFKATLADSPVYSIKLTDSTR